MKFVREEAAANIAKVAQNVELMWEEIIKIKKQISDTIPITTEILENTKTEVLRDVGSAILNPEGNTQLIADVAADKAVETPQKRIDALEKERSTILHAIQTLAEGQYSLAKKKQRGIFGFLKKKKDNPEISKMAILIQEAMKELKKQNEK
jgi:hypothetical protein